MSVLLVTPPEHLGGPIIERLIAQGDEVRVVVNPADAADWRRLGAHVAVGEPDGDLLERAGQSSRTIALFDPIDELAQDAIAAAQAARIDRVVAVLSRPSAALSTLLSGSELTYVVLVAARKGLKRAPDAAKIAEAVDAADDLAGEVRLELDLAEPGAWDALGIER